MNVVDTSGWIEAFLDDPNAGFFKPVIRQLDELIVPTISIYEVYRIVLRLHGKDIADEAATAMTSAAIVVDLDHELATSAATLAHSEKLAMADSIILATAVKHRATLWTQDADLKRFPNVKFREKRKA